MIFCASAPGSLMLFGEHAVLHGKQAISCAVDQRIRVCLTPRADRQVCITSTPLGRYVADLDALSICAPFEFVLAAITHYRERIRSGFDLTIDAEFASTLGLGSSSAVTVAAVAALTEWLELKLSATELFKEAKQVVLAVQGLGSGADVAAAVFGGIVAYRAQPLAIQPFAWAPDLALVYSGAKTPTRTVIAKVAAQQQLEPERYQALYERIDECALQAVAALSTQNWQRWGELMNHHHQLQSELSVSTPLLDEIAAGLRAQTQIQGAKISGSGLGDCVVGLGSIDENLFPQNDGQRRAGVVQIPVKISLNGYRNEKN